MNTILIVDDEYDRRYPGLRPGGGRLRGEKAINGKKALEMLVAESVQLVITDYMMPVLNGEELVRAMRDCSALREVPVILMSGAQASQVCPALFEAIFDKPFDMDKMIAKVRELLKA